MWLTSASGGARAGGYDTPMLYSARHIGMGGTAVGYVNDASALFHNPAGLAHVPKLSLLANFSLLLARTKASPNILTQNAESDLTVAPLFLLGAGYRLNDLVTVGLGIYPVASAGATYTNETTNGMKAENTTRLLFIEASPGVSFNLPYNVRLGLGYRITYVSLERFQGLQGAGTMPLLDFSMTGTNFLGFRLGAQWTPLDWLQLGVSYRHKTTTTVRNDSGIALSQRFTDIETDFVLPSKLSGGGRADIGNFGLALDAEYTFNSQNEAYPLVGTQPATATMPAMQVAVPNVFNWSNEITLRAGIEYWVTPWVEGLAVRAGYVYDGKTTNPLYPSAFGTPPAATHVVTGGLGYAWQRWQVNVAYAHRAGTGTASPGMAGDEGYQPCAFCGLAGDYSIRINGFYADASLSFD